MGLNAEVVGIIGLIIKGIWVLLGLAILAVIGFALYKFVMLFISLLCGSLLHRRQKKKKRVRRRP